MNIRQHFYRVGAFRMDLRGRLKAPETGSDAPDFLDAIRATTQAELEGLKQDVLKETGIQALRDEVERAKSEFHAAWESFLGDAQAEILKSFGIEVDLLHKDDAPEDDGKSDSSGRAEKRFNTKPPADVPVEDLPAVTRVLNVVHDATQNHADHLTYVRDAAQKYGVPEAYLMAVVAEESAWKVDAMNGGLKGAVGLGQIIPSTRDLLLKNRELKTMASSISGDPRLDAHWNVHAMAFLIKDNARMLRLNPQNPEDWMALSVAYHDGPEQARRFLKGQDLTMVSGYRGLQKRFNIDVQNDQSYTAFVKRLAKEYSWSAKALAAALKTPEEPDTERLESVELGPDYLSFDKAGFAILKKGVRSGDQPYLTGDFGEKRSDHIHEGVDLANIQEGTAIAALRPFRVLRKAYEGDGAGHHVVVEMDGEERKFFHLQEKSGLLAGKSYPAGTVIGKVGNTGHSSGVHIHFERAALKGGAPIDPTEFFEGLPHKA